MIKKFFYFSYAPKNTKGLLIAFATYLIITVLGTAVRGLLNVLGLSLVGGLLGLFTSVYSFIGICLLLYQYLIKNKEK